MEFGDCGADGSLSGRSGADVDSPSRSQWGRECAGDAGGRHVRSGGRVSGEPVCGDDRVSDAGDSPVESDGAGATQAAGGACRGSAPGGGRVSRGKCRGGSGDAGRRLSVDSRRGLDGGDCAGDRGDGANGGGRDARPTDLGGARAGIGGTALSGPAAGAAPRAAADGPEPPCSGRGDSVGLGAGGCLCRARLSRGGAAVPASAERGVRPVLPGGVSVRPEAIGAGQGAEVDRVPATAG